MNLERRPTYSSIRELAYPAGADGLVRALRYVLYAVAVVTVAWHLYYAYTRPVIRMEQGVIHFGLLLAVFYIDSMIEIHEEATGLRRKLNLLATGLLALAVAVCALYVFLNTTRWVTEGRSMFLYTNLDLAVGVVIVFVSVHSTWRAYGRLLGIVTVLILLYGLAGPYFPGILFHTGFDVERLIHLNTISFRGVFGFIMQIGATWVIMFIMFTGFIEAYGGLDYIIDFSKRVGRNFRSGIMEIAVVSSMLIGSIMGSSAANAATTGSFTIPMMKDEGVEPRFAAAIESVASTGGQVMPPIMGATAFIVADILNISYLEVLKASTLPAIVMYASAAIGVFLLTAKRGWGRTDPDIGDSRTARRTGTDRIVEPLPYAIPFALLVYLLAALRMSPLTAGLYSIVACILLALFRDVVQDGLSVRSVISWARDTLEGCKLGAVNMAPLTAVIAALGIMIRTLVSTGLTGRFSIRAIALSGGILVLLLLIAMVASIMLGMAMPTPAAYIIVAILSAPPLVELGIEPLAAHLFVLYFAVLSTITPPVALTCAVTSSLSGASFWETAKETIRLGLFLFMIPYVFVFNPPLLFWDGLATVETFVLVLIGMFAVMGGLIGYAVRDLSYPERLVYFLLGVVVLLAPASAARYVGTVLVVVLLAFPLARESGDESTGLFPR